MKPYNGFLPAHRMKALYWLRAEYAAGRRTPPVVCDLCGQTRGLIDAHSEDYSKPFGDHIGEFGLCFQCHIALHGRFSFPARWARMLELFSAGAIFEPIYDRKLFRLTYRPCALSGGTGPNVKGRELLSRLRTERRA